MKKYRCQICGYIYDPADSKIQPGTLFESLPDFWACPECGIGVNQFEMAD